MVSVHYMAGFSICNMYCCRTGAWQVRAIRVAGPHIHSMNCLLDLVLH